MSFIKNSNFLRKKMLSIEIYMPYKIELLKIKFNSCHKILMSYFVENF